MQKRPGVVSVGTARDLANVGVGYTGSGASEHTRQAAHGKGGSHDGVVLGGKVWRERVTVKASTLADHNRKRAIFKIEAELEQLRRHLKMEKSPTRLSRFKKDFEQRQEFLAHLRRAGR
jgi:hypothetical protein